MATTGARRLGAAILAERSRRWPRREDFAKECGLSRRLLAAVENAERDNFSPATYAAIERALSWEPGTAKRIKAGMRIRRCEDPELTEVRDLWPDLSRDARRMVVAVIRYALD